MCDMEEDETVREDETVEHVILERVKCGRDRTEIMGVILHNLDDMVKKKKGGNGWC